MALQTGLWRINGNGHTGELRIDAVDAQGNVTGAVFGQALLGFWDERAGRLVFMRLTDPGTPSSYQIYTGFLFQNRGGSPLDGVGDIHFTLAGSFDAFAGSGASAQRTQYGWYAMMGIPT